MEYSLATSGAMKATILTLCCLKSCPLYQRSQQTKASPDTQEHAKQAAGKKAAQTAHIFDLRARESCRLQSIAFMFYLKEGVFLQNLTRSLRTSEDA